MEYSDEKAKGWTVIIFFKKVADMVWNNKEWAFSGFGVVLIVGLISLCTLDNTPETQDEVYSFETQIRVVFSGAWKSGKVPTTSGIIVLGEPDPALEIKVNLKSGESKDLGLYTDGNVKITETHNKRAILEYNCKVKPGAWIFGYKITEIKNFSMIYLDLHGVNTTIVKNPTILLETIEIGFFINGIQRSTYMKSPYRTAKTLDPAIRLRWPPDNKPTSDIDG